MFRHVLITCALMLLPAVASAQRGMGGSKEADWNAVMSGTPRGPSISGKDFAEHSPLAALLDKKKDLKLTEEQITAIKAADEKLQAANAERYKLVDSLKKLMKPSIAPNAEDEARVLLAREGMMGVVREIGQSHDAEGKAIIGTLDASQQEKATEVLTKHAEKTQKMLREKLGPSGGPPGAGRGRGGRGGVR